MRAAENVMACELGEGLALLHHDSGTFFLLDEVGSYIWQRLTRPGTAAEISAAVVDEFDGPVEQIERDVRDIIQSMVDADLLEVRSQ